MSGNVKEWCQDWYSILNDVHTQANPQGPDYGTRKVVRGGSNQDLKKEFPKVWERSSTRPEDKYTSHGLRLALPAE